MPLKDRGVRAGYLDPVIVADVDEAVQLPVINAPGTALSVDNFMLEVARGNVAGITGVNKFGRTTDADLDTPTDIWDRANATDTQPIWVAPTTARIHNIVSTSASDDGAPLGVGARTIRIYGLPDWNTPSADEIITLNGMTDVPTVNSYVIIFRMMVLTEGISGPNVGTITATAQTDGTVTAQINPSQGQTQMAIFGIPSTQTVYMTHLYSNFNRTGATGGVDISLLANQEPIQQISTFVVRHTFGVLSSGTSAINVSYKPYKKFTGPALIKIQATATNNDTDISGGFDMMVVDN